MKTHSEKAFLFASGGTGGHIIPACRIASYLREKYHARILFLGGKRGLESKIVPDWGFDIVTIDIQPMPRKIGMKALAFPFMLLSATLKARSQITKFNPDAIISTGGFASGPSSLAAMTMRTPLFLQEQNSFPGITQRYASLWAKRVYYSFPDSIEYFKSAKNAVLMGNPVNITDNDFSKEAFLLSLGLNPDKPTVFVTGGSQGAASINSAIKDICDFSLAFNIIWQVGTRNYKEIASSFGKKPPENVSLHHFVREMDKFYRASDMVISRAGALSLSEIAVYKKPSILVPYPYAAADHQTKNAQSFEKAGAAIMLKDSDISSEILLDTLNTLLADVDRLKDMSLNASKMGKPNALKDICEDIMDYLEI